MPFVDVPGYGRFEPALPAWLELRPDGKLYNKNAADPNRPWTAPAAKVVAETWTYTPEALVPPPEPPPPPELPADVKAALEHQRAAIALAEASLDADQQHLDAQRALVAAARKLVDDYEARLLAALKE